MTGALDLSYPDTFTKRPHRPGCTGALYRTVSRIYVDRIGRSGNGPICAHDYRCLRDWDGCLARVLVTERAVRALATAAEERP